MDEETDVMVKLPPRVEQPAPDRVYEPTPRHVPSSEVGYGPAPRMAGAPTEKMLSLLNELIKERDPANLSPELVEALDRYARIGNCSYNWARKMINGLMACERYKVRYATRGMVNYIKILCDRLGQPPQVRMEYLKYEDADAEIKRLKKAVGSGDGRSCVPDGLYTLHNQLYKVAVNAGGRVVARQLKVLDEPVIQADGRSRLYAFEPVHGVLHRLTLEMRLTEEQARSFGKLSGCCVRCGITLIKDESLDRAMGPVCWEKTFG